MNSVLMPSLEFDRCWQDVFGTVIASLERGSRNRSVLIVTSSEYGPVAVEALAKITFQGRLVLAILEQLHHAPLEAVLRDQAPSFVIALEPTLKGISTHGQAILGNPSLEVASTGLEYFEPGSYISWKNAHTRPTDPQASSVTASVVSTLGLPCFVCHPSDLKTAFEFVSPK